MVKIVGYAGKDEGKLSIFMRPLVDAFLSNPSQERLGTSLEVTSHSATRQLP